MALLQGFSQGNNYNNPSPSPSPPSYKGVSSFLQRCILQWSPLAYTFGSQIASELGIQVRFLLLKEMVKTKKIREWIQRSKLKIFKHFCDFIFNLYMLCFSVIFLFYLFPGSSLINFSWSFPISCTVIYSNFHSYLNSTYL